MFKDYHYILRCVFEIRHQLIGLNIVEIFSQEKDRIQFYIPTEENPHQHLIISCNPQLPFLQVRKELHKAKKNTVNFFDENLPAKITDFRIAHGDRIVNLATDKADYFYFIRGSKTNIISYNYSGSMQTFKKLITPEDGLKSELIEKEYLTEYFESEYELNSITSYSGLKKSIPFLSRILYEEIIYRNEESGITIDKILNQCLNEVIENEIAVGTSTDSHNLIFQPASFKRNVLDNVKVFKSYNDAIQYYISNFYREKQFSTQFKFLSEHLDKHLSVLSNRLNNLKIRLEKGCKDDLYYKYGQLLLVNLHTIQQGQDYTILDDYLTGDEIRVELDPRKNIQENANSYFEKAKDEKKNYRKSQDLFDSTRIKYETYIKFKNEIESLTQIDDLRFIEEQLNIKREQNKEKVDERINFREYIISNKYKAFVGKDSKSNDLLTIKMAKQNDYWFHARGYSGSHVILRVDNTKEAIPKSVLNDVASIAAFYSKAKTAKVAPVAYTLRKYVRKNKNMNPGQVLLMKEKVLLVRPEIPKSAEETE